MPKLFEIFGYPSSDNSEEARENREKACCPFMNRDCDGGGNRYLSHVELSPKHPLKSLYPRRIKLPAGVCSIQLRPDSSPWIVCPRRLLVLGREKQDHRARQKETETQTLKYFEYPSGTQLGIWPELKLKYSGETPDGIKRSFDYTFDYIIMPVKPVSQLLIEKVTHKKWSALQRGFENAGYTIAKRGKEFYVEDYPMGTPSIVEIMTSSTSGGNKKNRTTIPMAFEDAMLGKFHNAPGINYRQVWARMVSQLIVKSEIALGWGGKTIWVVQDTLINYICSSTRLDIRQFLSEHTSEVNMLSFSYGDAFKKHRGVIELVNGELFAGPMSSMPSNAPDSNPSFQDIIRAPICPPLDRLVNLLTKRVPANKVVAP